MSLTPDSSEKELLDKIPIAQESLRSYLQQCLFVKYQKKTLEAQSNQQEEVLKIEREALSQSAKYQRWTVGVAGATLIASVAVSFWVPWYQHKSDEHLKIQAVYKNLVTNQDIFISNSSNVRTLQNSDDISSLPEEFITDEIDGDTRNILQDKFGLIQYRFFLTYLQHTTIMNKEIEQMRDYSIITNQAFGKLNPTDSYISTMSYLASDELVGFNYQKDTECLQYFFEKTFSYLNVDGRGKALECDDDSLDRLFNVGFLQMDTPQWLLPQLRRALNNRESGLGDRVIN